METAWRVSAIQALWQAIRCLDEENAIAALESAIANGFVPRADLNRLCVLAPRRLQGGIRLLIPNSGSGNETIARLRLIRAGYSVAAQGTVPGLGRQDLVINGCVGIEVDSALWHGEKQRLNDVERDLRAEGFGRRTLRIYPTHIHKSWSRTLAVIDRMVRDANRGRIATRRDAAGF